MAIAGKYWQSFGGEMENGKRLPRGWFLCSPSVQFFVELFETFFPTRAPRFKGPLLTSGLMCAVYT